MIKHIVAKSKVALIVACFMSLSVSLTGCGGEKELTNSAEYEGSSIELTGSEIETTDTGKEVLRVSATYTNSNSEPQYDIVNIG